MKSNCFNSYILSLILGPAAVTLLCDSKFFLYFFLIFCFISEKRSSLFSDLFFLHIWSLCIVFVSLSYLDLSHCDTDDGTRTLDPHWWRVNKPSLGVTEAMSGYRLKESWLKGILIKRKIRGKMA